MKAPPTAFRLVLSLGIIALLIYIFLVLSISPGYTSQSHHRPRFRHKGRVTVSRGKHTAVKREELPVRHHDGKKKLPDGATPHIIHQIWKTEYVHGSMAEWVRSWTIVNEKWTHVLWTHEMTLDLISTEYPDFLSVYNNYSGAIFRADAARHFILHKFGGVYVDLDTECLRAIAPVVDSHACVVAQEPHSHASLLHKRSRTFVSNAFMACRKGHPFLKSVIEYLPKATSESELMSMTGPFMVDKVAMAYKKSKRTGTDALYVAPPHYFQPTFDETNLATFRRQCTVLLAPPGVYQRQHMDELLQYDLPVIWKQRGDCSELARKNFTNLPEADSFTNHHWVHTYWYPGTYNGEKEKRENVHIRDIVPGIVMGSELMQRLRDAGS